MSASHSPKAPSGDEIDRMQQRRTRVMMAMGLLFVIWQGNFFSLEGPADRLVDQVKVVGYVAWTVMLLLLLATGGAYWRPKQVREILNDESTKANRAKALSSAFYVAMAAALAGYIGSFFITLTGREVAHLSLSAGIATALFAFVAQERRAMRDA